MPNRFPLTRGFADRNRAVTWVTSARSCAAAASRRHPVPAQHGRCAEAQLGCPCRGDAAIHQQRSAEIDEARARAGEQVECPECGGTATPLQIVTWGHCLPCRTADSRTTSPLRW